MSWPESQGAAPRPPMPSIRQWPIVWWIIGINVAVFVADVVSQRALRPLGYFSAATAIQQLQLWRLLTFQFLHVDGWHLFFNMLSLFYFGKYVEARLGRLRFSAFYLLCGVAGAVSYLVLWLVGVLPTHARTPLIGASAGVFGVLVAAAVIVPNARVMLMFPPIVMRLKTMVWIFLGIGLLIVISSGPNAGGEAAHLGGAVCGWLLMLWLHRPPPKRTSTFWKPGDPPDKFFRNP